MQMRSIFAAALLGLTHALDVQVVYVGMNPATNETKLAYFPEKVTAAPGTMVQFQFLAGKHTITQSNFDDACVPVGNVDPSAAGIFSGPMDVAAAKAAQGLVPTYTIMINDTKPIWLYCTTGPHCANGMSMVINENTSANASRSLENYKAIASTFTGTSPQPNDSGSSPAPSDGGSSPAPTDGGSGDTPTSTSPADSNQSSTFVTSPTAPTSTGGAAPDTTLPPSAGSALSAPLAVVFGAIGAALALA